MLLYSSIRALLAVILFLTASAKAPGLNTIGINLGPTHLTAAYAPAVKGEFTVVNARGSKAYRDLFVGILETQSAGTGTLKDYPASTKSIFFSALKTIKTVAEMKLGHSVDIGIISQPLYFNVSTSNALTDAAKELQTEIAGQVVRFTNVARIAYGLNSCKGFDMNSTNCDINEGEHAVIVVDYNTEYLEIAIGYVREEICSVRGYKRVKELGEDHISSSSYGEDLRKVLEEFRGGYFATFDFWDYGAHVRGVVLSGDASKSGMDGMRKYIAQAWPEQYKNRFKDSIDPWYVGAVGAARMVQIEALRDLDAESITGDEDDDNDNEDNAHDEL